MSIDYVSKYCKNKELCEIYSDISNNDKFMVGYIIAYDEQFLIITQIDQYGKYDGFACILMRDVIRIQVKTSYLARILKLIQYQNTNLKTMSFENCILDNIIEFVKKNSRVCLIELCNSAVVDIIGYIKEYNPKENKAIVLLIDDDGKIDGESEIDCGYLSSLIYDSKDAKKIEILSKL